MTRAWAKCPTQNLIANQFQRLMVVLDIKSFKFHKLAWEIIIPHLLVEVEAVEEINEGEYPNHGEKEHHQGVEELDHVPVHTLIPELLEAHFSVVNLFLLFSDVCQIDTICK